MSSPILEVRNLKKYFRLSGNRTLKAVDDVSFAVNEGEILGIVGESGCGKTTCGRTAIGLYSKTAGEALFRGEDIHKMSKSKRKQYCCEVQTVFQDPYASLDPKNKVIDLIAEGMDIHKFYTSKGERREKIEEIMSQVGLNPSFVDRYPFEFSGGMRQRIGIARALAVNPKLILCDEPISALDVSIQAQIINLLMELREKNNLTYMIISHDLSMVKHISDRILVMYLGEVVEESTADALYENPLHPYTQALISAIPIPDPKVECARKRIVLTGQLPSPVNPPEGCRFAGRCPMAEAKCFDCKPELKTVEDGHKVACHKY
ncbi:MAG: ATP-binding cassette domain-containing protein [Clostridia bacterium]|nr:ATP-binding cassette domain-containing protein [Clostridia bacterium]